MEKVRIYVEQITEGQVLLTDAQLAQFEQYYDMLIEKNKVMNLTAITEREEVILKHFIDSLALAGYVKMWEKPYKIIDVGTGAGFPGIPLKIAFPNLQVTLFDSLNKRIKFLQEVIDALNLNEISAVHGRAEEGAREKAMREKYDFVVSRAVANMAVLSEYCHKGSSLRGLVRPLRHSASDHLDHQRRSDAAEDRDRRAGVRPAQRNVQVHPALVAEHAEERHRFLTKERS